MRITAELTDEALLAELGSRLRRYRLARNITQGQLGEQAGVARQTVARLEAGGEVKLPAFLRVLRALELLEGIEQAVPEPPVSPIQNLERHGRQRQRARPHDSEPRGPARPWRWGDGR
jgi:transcriptional regulator with XRE-family HTH domain